MRSRTLTTFAPLLLALALTACGGGGGTITLGAPGQPSATTDSSDPGATATDDPAADPAADQATTEDTVLGEDGAAAPGGTDLDKCLAIGKAFSGIAGSAGSMSPDEAQAAVGKMKSLLPPELSDDIQTMIDVYAADPSKVADAASSKAFLDANTAVTNYLTQICGAG